MLTSQPLGLRVLLLTADPRDADLITCAVQRTNFRNTVVQANSGATFVRALEVFEPDVILCDHGVADLSAAGALRLAQARLPASPFLLLADTFEQSDCDCLKMGAWDFILRSNLSRLLPAINLAMDACIPLRRLSRRQREVLQMLAMSCSTREIARRLRLSVKTVETHRAAVMKRLEIHQVANLVRYSLRVGLVQREQPRDLEHAVA
ncbi:MAG TPA: response regulator transcription factor [Gemmatimonadales bacterium]|nr:response regulator transcription factor [Gemmatimonadales bacterium]